MTEPQKEQRFLRLLTIHFWTGLFTGQVGLIRPSLRREVRALRTVLNGTRVASAILSAEMGLSEALSFFSTVSWEGVSPII
jgi:hypothetical protein